MVTASELPINSNASALVMANEIFGSGVTVVNASYTGDNLSSATYSNGLATAPGVVPGDTGVILSTGYARDFTNSFGQSNQSTGTSTNTTGQNGNSQFNQAAGAFTYDASYLTVDFIPTGNVMTMQFVFASEEYPEYTNGIYQDFVGVWVNGAQVDLAIGDGDVDPSNLNNSNNQSLFIDNTQDQFNTEMDGFTVTMTLKMTVVPGQVNTFRIGIADVNDSSYDSTVLIAGNSAQTALIANDDDITMGINSTQTLNVLANDTGPGNSTLTITHINGQAVTAGSSVTLVTGQVITLNANGTLSVATDGDTESVNFTYKVAAGGGNGLSDTAFVTVNQVPCFVAGTMILTTDGERPVETLTPGDLVITKDDGPQPLRWIGRRSVPAKGDFAPIHIAPNTFGNHRALLLSPLHRVLIRDALAELLFGDAEVLVAAKDLVNDRSVRRIEGGEVEYVHILFDRHQVVLSEGLETESFLPGPQIRDSFEAEALEEICSLFPEIDPSTGDGYSPAARRTLKGFEARVLASVKAA